MFEEYPNIMTPDEVHKALRISKGAVYKLLHSGQLKHFRIGRNIKIPKYALIELMELLCYNNGSNKVVQLPQERS